MMRRFLFALLLLPLLPSVSAAGTVYTPAASGGVSGAGAGVTDAGAFRTALSLGTAATVNTGVSMGTVPVIGMGDTLPAISGVNLTGITSSQISGLSTPAWDWAQGAPSGGVWSDAAGAGAVDDVCVTTVLSGAIKIRAGYESDCSTPYGSVARAVGAVASVGAGNFRVAVRLQLSRPGVDRATGSTVLVAGPVFVDGASVASNSWYGVGVYLTGSTLLNSAVLKLDNTSGADRWGAYDGGTFSTALASPSWSEVDYVIERTGTTLNIYAAPARGAGWLIATHTVSDAGGGLGGAGLIGIRSQAIFVQADEIDVAILAYRTGLADLPW